jgi:predicted transglutaminase-like cysteine proteinase
MLFSRWRATAPCAIFALYFAVSALLSPAAALQLSGMDADRVLPVQKPFTIPDIAPAEKAEEPFRVTATNISSGGLIRKWNDVRAGLARDYQTLKQCRRDPASCDTATARFQALVDTARSLTGRARIAAVNHAVNQAIRPMTDLDQYGQMEFWATPLMTFTSGAGDCEDYAIAKYAALVELGIPAGDLRLLAVYDRDARENHAVAAVRFKQRWLILDNIAADVQDVSRRTNLKPLFVLADQWVRQADASQPPAIEAQAPVSRFTMSDLPESWSIKFGLITPLL